MEAVELANADQVADQVADDPCDFRFAAHTRLLPEVLPIKDTSASCAFLATPSRVTRKHIPAKCEKGRPVTDALTWPIRKLWGGITRTGRILLWLVFWPVGLWRSLVHGRKKRDAELLREMRRPQS